MIDVVVVTNSSMTAELIRLALRSAGGMRVLGYVDGRRGVGPAIAYAQPSVILLDEATVASEGLQCIRDSRTAAPEAKLLVLVHDMQRPWLVEALSAGADALISTATPPRSLATVVREIARGRVYHQFTRKGSVRPQADAALTDRELEVLRLMAAGAPNSRIGRHLNVTEQTVKFHLSNVYRKLKVANRTQASHYAHVTGLLESESRGQIAVEAA
jgi:DNA-binding NarL/FixJ family response regulator